MKKLSKKSAILTAAAILAAAALSVSAVESIALPFQGNSANATEAQTTAVNLEEAKAIAFAKAGVAESEAYDKDFDFEQGYYEINFDFDGMDYEYKISASTGEIVFESIKPDNDPKPQQSTQKPEQPTQPTVPTEPAKKLTIEEAKAIAFAKAGVSEADAFDKDFDLEKGFYEIDFDFNGMEYEYKINAETGEIVYENAKPDDDVRPQQNQSAQQSTQQPAQNKISADEAKNKALADVGLTEAEIYDRDFDLEWGVYEIDFEANGIEYEYVIDAETGEILNVRTEKDDDYREKTSTGGNKNNGNRTDRRDDDWDDRYDDDDDDWDDRYDDDDDDDWDDRYDRDDDDDHWED